ERMDVAMDGFQVLDPGARDRQQLKVDREKGLAHDVQTGSGQERMDVGDPSGDRVLDRDHGEFGRAVLYGRESILEGRAGQRSEIGKIVGAGDMRIGARFALIGDRICCLHACFPGASMTRARSKSSGASTPSGAVSTSATSIRMPASNARNCSSFSRRSRGEGKDATNRRSAPRR